MRIHGPACRNRQVGIRHRRCIATPTCKRVSCLAQGRIGNSTTVCQRIVCFCVIAGRGSTIKVPCKLMRIYCPLSYTGYIVGRHYSRYCRKPTIERVAFTSWISRSLYIRANLLLNRIDDRSTGTRHKGNRIALGHLCKTK